MSNRNSYSQEEDGSVRGEFAHPIRTVGEIPMHRPGIEASMFTGSMNASPSNGPRETCHVKCRRYPVQSLPIRSRSTCLKMVSSRA